MIRRAAAVALLALTAAAPSETTVGGHTYRFPPNAFQGGMVETGRVGSILLQVKWPSLEGLSFADQLGPVGSRTLLILANSGADVDGDALPPERLAEATRESIVVAVSDGSKPAFPLHPASSAAAHGPVPGSGMEQVEADSGPGGAPDVFVGPSLAEPQEVIGCTISQPDFVATCYQRFTERNLLIRVSYGRTLVDQWRAIHADIGKLLSDHEPNR